MRKHVIAALCWFLTICIAGYDMYLSIKYAESLAELEKNPVGSFLIDLDNGGVAIFMAFKLVGCCIATSLIFPLYHFRPKHGLSCVLAVTAFQVWLLWYLNS